MIDLIQYPRMLWSSHAGWDRLAQSRPSAAQLFVSLVLPLSLLPPLMLIHASAHIGALYFPTVEARIWWIAAGLFFTLEQLTVPAIAWLVLELSRTNGGRDDLHAAYSVAAVAPVPLWLSSLILFHDGIALAIAVPALALLGSAALIHHGVEALLRIRDEVVAAEVANIAIAAGLLAWSGLVCIALMPILVAR